ncbi:hypothetical protein Peur_027208 [Populus x canadensis]
MYSVYLSTEPPHRNLVLTDMDSPLVNKLMGCAKAVSDGNLKPADFLFEEMEGRRLRSAETSEVTKKVVRCFAEALARRVHGLHPSNPIPLLPSIEMQNPLHLFATTATNYDMLETLITGRSKPLHFIDFSMVLSSSVFRASEQYDTVPGIKLFSEMHLKRQISNVVASEGIDRFERHHTFSHGQERLSEAGSRSTQLWSN